MAKTYDSKCYELAEHFLAESEEPTELASLACAIQQSIEDWMEEQRAAAEEQEARDEEQRSLKGYTDEERARI